MGRGLGLVDIRDIQALADRIVQEFHPERIILFGSYAGGTPNPDSDVDLLVVLPFEGKSWYMASEIRKRVRSPFPMDLLVRTSDQVRQGINNVLLQEITQKGKVLYEV